MKIKLLSDLHMEGNNFFYQFHGEDVVVLAGDINTRNRHEDLLFEIPDHVKVVMVSGNHEYYHSVFEEVNEYLRNLSTKFPNFKFLHNSSTTIDDVEFFGGIMCTDFNLFGPHEQWFGMDSAKKSINDFHVTAKISDTGELRRWTITDHENEHEQFKQNLKVWLKHTEGKKRVVISHFVPTPKAVHPRWGGKENPLNSYFTANMEEYMGWDGLWLFGHTHDSSDFMIDSTRCVCNPHGYAIENATNFKHDLILNI